MTEMKKHLFAIAFLLLFLTAAASSAEAKGSEYGAVVKHLKTKYRAKKVKIPFLWLARAAVSIARPAGVKSFSVTTFENLQFSRATLDEEMQTTLRRTLSDEWNPIFRVRSRAGEQVYMYMREAGASVKIMIVTIDKDQAAIVRATFNPEKLAEFINDPKIFGVSLNDDEPKAKNNARQTKENPAGENAPPLKN